MDPKAKILMAALRVFARHGYRHTSMSMVADEAALSRQAVYHHFASKELLFSALVGSLQERAHEEVEAALAAMSGTSLAERLYRALIVQHEVLVGDLAGSPYAAELMDESARYCSDIVSAHMQKFQKYLEGVVAQALASGNVALQQGISQKQFVSMLMMAAKGVKVSHVQSSPRVHAQALEQMVMTMCRGAVDERQRAGTSSVKGIVAGRAR
jgi:AcrR family transcriptional regulator